MAIAMDIPELRTAIAEAVEIVPPHWIDDDALIELEQRYEPLVFERFADGTLLVTPPAGFYSGGRNAELTSQVGNWASAGDRGTVIDSSGGFNLPTVRSSLRTRRSSRAVARSGRSPSARFPSSSRTRYSS